MTGFISFLSFSSILLLILPLLLLQVYNYVIIWLQNLIEGVDLRTFPPHASFLPPPCLTMADSHSPGFDGFICASSVMIITCGSQQLSWNFLLQHVIRFSRFHACVSFEYAQEKSTKVSTHMLGFYNIYSLLCVFVCLRSSLFCERHAISYLLLFV